MRQFSDACIVVTSSVLVVIAVVLLACCTCFAQQNAGAAPLPVPKQLFPVKDGMSLAELQALRGALARDSEMARDETWPPVYEPSQFADLNISGVNLGALGRGFLVYFNRSGACGATGNCPMALYIRGQPGYRPALHFGGWGSWIVPSSAAVPDVVSAWNMSCCDEIYTRYRYRNGRFVADACAEGLSDPDSDDPERMSWKACKTGVPTFELDTSRLPATNPAPTYREFEQLRTLAEPDMRSLGKNFTQLSVTALPHWLVVGIPAGTGARVFVYPRLQNGTIGAAVLRNAPAEFVAESETEARAEPDTLPSPFPIPALVLALRSGTAMTMRLYVEPETGVQGLPDNGRMELESCHEVTSSTGAWQRTLDPAALSIRAVSCEGLR